MVRDSVLFVSEVVEQALVSLPFERNASLSEILFETGGFCTEMGNLAKIYVLRPGKSDKVTAYHLDAKNIVNLTIASFMEIRPSDIIFVKTQPIKTWGRTLQ